MLLDDAVDSVQAGREHDETRTFSGRQLNVHTFTMDADNVIITLTVTP